jgi:hypothetical protein
LKIGRCLNEICGRKPSDPHHLRYLQPRAIRTVACAGCSFSDSGLTSAAGRALTRGFRFMRKYRSVRSVTGGNFALQLEGSIINRPEDARLHAWIVVSFDGIASNQAAFSKWPKNPDQVQNVRVFISKIPRLNLLFEFADNLFKRIVIFTYRATASHASSTSTNVTKKRIGWRLETRRISRVRVDRAPPPGE